MTNSLSMHSKLSLIAAFWVAQIAALQADTPAATATKLDVVYKTTEQGPLKLDLHYPATPKAGAKVPLVLFTHGGGWIACPACWRKACACSRSATASKMSCRRPQHWRPRFPRRHHESCFRRGFELHPEIRQHLHALVRPCRRRIRHPPSQEARTLDDRCRPGERLFALTLHHAATKGHHARSHLRIHQGRLFHLKEENDRVVTVVSETELRIARNTTSVKHLPHGHVEILNQFTTAATIQRALSR
jgi:hypothetical protein